MYARIISGVNDEELISISENLNIEWRETDKEFLLNGELYDVVRIKQKKSRRVLLCVTDEKESTILKKFERFASHDQKRSSEKANGFVKLSIPQISEIADLSIKVDPLPASFSSLMQPALLSLVRKIFLPPPRC